MWIPRFLGAAVAVALLVAGSSAAVWSVSDDAIRIVEDLPRAARQMRETIRQQRRGARDDTPLEKVQEAANELEKTAVEAAPAPTRAERRAARPGRRADVPRGGLSCGGDRWASWGSRAK